MYIINAKLFTFPQPKCYEVSYKQKKSEKTKQPSEGWDMTTILYLSDKEYKIPLIDMIRQWSCMQKQIDNANSKMETQKKYS